MGCGCSVEKTHEEQVVNASQKNSKKENKQIIEESSFKKQCKIEIPKEKIIINNIDTQNLETERKDNPGEILTENNKPMPDEPETVQNEEKKVLTLQNEEQNKDTFEQKIDFIIDNKSEDIKNQLRLIDKPIKFDFKNSNKNLDELKKELESLEIMRNQLITTEYSAYFNSGVCELKEVNITKYIESVFLLIAYEMKGSIDEAEIEILEIPPFMRIKNNKVGDSNKELFNQMMDFIITIFQSQTKFQNLKKNINILSNEIADSLKNSDFEMNLEIESDLNELAKMHIIIKEIESFITENLSGIKESFKQVRNEANSRMLRSKSLALMENKDVKDQYDIIYASYDEAKVGDKGKGKELYQKLMETLEMKL